MEHILFLNVSYPLEPLCRALRAGGAVSTVTENVAEWVHLSAIRPWSLCVIAVETVGELPELAQLPERTALLVLSEEALPNVITYRFMSAWCGGVSASTVLRLAAFRSLVIADAPGEFAIGDLMINVSDRTMWWAGKELHLTPRQFAIVRLLASQPGRIFSRVEIWEHCWGLADYPESNAVDAHIRRIRRRLPPELGRSIRTAYGVGYRLLPYGKLTQHDAVLMDEVSESGRQALAMI